MPHDAADRGNRPTIGRVQYLWAPNGFAAIPTPPLIRPDRRRLLRSPRFRVRVDFYLVRRPGNQHNTVGVDALLLPTAKFVLGGAGVINQLAPQPEAGRSALAISHRDQSALSGEDLDRQLPAILARHHPFQGFDDMRNRAAVVLKLFSAIMNLDLRNVTASLVIRTFIRILEASPATDVIDQDHREIRSAVFDVIKQ